MTSLRWKFLWPIALSSLCLMTLCVFTAISLFRQQLSINQVLQENVASRRAALEMEACLVDIVTLLRERADSAPSLHPRAREHLDAIRNHSDQPKEMELSQKLEKAYAEYLDSWKEILPPGKEGREDAIANTTELVETGLIKVCEELEKYNGLRIEEATQDQNRLLRQLAWGMAGVSGLGGIAGVVIGFGVARGLNQSIRRLHVQIQDAAGKLGRDTPTIVLTEDGDLGGLHEQVELLTARIETVVEELQQREREVLRAEQLAAVGQLAAGVAHEIRNPLTSIKMLVQTGLEEEGPSGLTTEDLRVIESEVRRLERSLQTFLNFARPPKLERRPLDLVPLVNGVLGLIRGRAEKQGVVVDVDLPSSGVHVTADGEQVQQVLVNLALNALDAMPSGGRLRVLLRATRVGGAELLIEDTGPGVPPEIKAKLFQPFVSTKDTGLGLGLVIVRRIVENHGGTITVENRDKGGAVFSLYLPGATSQAVRAGVATFEK